MNSPPESIAPSDKPFAPLYAREPGFGHPASLCSPPPSIPTMDTEAGPSAASGPGPGPGQFRLGPPSPASSGSAMAVGSSADPALIQSIEEGNYGLLDGEDTRSLTESIRQHVVDGGLRYHAYHAGRYPFPNDETEQAREDIKHVLTLLLFDDKLFQPPIHDLLERGAQVLDLGTGTGKWCIELADQYPNTEFHGMDLSPIQPDWVPENALFVVDDIEHEAGWTYPENKFDFIHIRHTVHSIRNRPQMWERIYKHLKPGGYLEVQEFHYTAACDDDSCDGPYALRDFLRFLKDGMASLGSDLNGIVHVERELREAGFEGLETRETKCPTGPWSKHRRLQECGQVLRNVIMWGLVGLSRRPFRDGLGWTMLQIEMFLVDVRKSLTEEVNGLPKYHSYFPFHNIYCRKPLDAQ